LNHATAVAESRTETLSRFVISGVMGEPNAESLASCTL
jgi:hypothetical protein